MLHSLLLDLLLRLLLDRFFRCQAHPVGDLAAAQRRRAKCTAGPPRMDHLRAYIGFSYIKYSRTSFIPFYYITEVLNLTPYWAAILGGPGRPKRPKRRPKRRPGGLSGPAA